MISEGLREKLIIYSGLNSRFLLSYYHLRSNEIGIYSMRLNLVILPLAYNSKTIYMAALNTILLVDYYFEYYIKCFEHMNS